MPDLKFLLLGAVFLQFVSSGYGMECSALGLAISCPTVLDKDSEIFCCQSNAQNIQYCCDIENYVKQNTAILAGIVVAALIVLILFTLCCCCCCSCCWLARRRTAGRVLG